jgi:fused chemotaxis regulator ; protein-glutamate methylesterase in two-component regulatory system with chea
MINKIRVLNVDDSAFVRKLLKDVFSSDKDFILIDQAKNGKEALELLSKNNYDVITLDVEMPVMNGIEALREIMKIKPTPVVMLSTETKDGATITIEALDIGAADFITKPKNIFANNNSDLKKEIITTVKNASKVNVKLLSLKKSGAHNAMVNKVDTVAKNNRISSGNSTLVKNIVTIGTSTGGPRALHEVIPNISGKINAPVLIVQHMPKGFTKSLADRLNMVSQLSVKEAEDGEILQNGFAYIAPGDKHLKIKSAGVDKYAVYLDGGDAINGHRPAVDAMMYSIADNPIKNVIAVVMTGMGNDGAKGLEKLKLVKNAKTISEDEKTCVVYGMPKAAAETGKVDMVVPLNNIANEINKLMGV